jgi:hypothetical protein
MEPGDLLVDDRLDATCRAGLDARIDAALEVDAAGAASSTMRIASSRSAPGRKLFFSDSFAKIEPEPTAS